MLHLKYPKGSLGSLSFRQKTGFLKVVVGLLGVFGIFYLGIHIAGSPKNLLSVVAAVSALPVGNVAATWLAMLPYSGCREEAAAGMAEKGAAMVRIYDLVITSKEAVMPIEAGVIHEKEICLFAPHKKIKPGAVEEYITAMLRSNELNAKVKVIKDLNLFLKELERLGREETLGRENEDLLKKEGLLIALSM